MVVPPPSLCPVSLHLCPVFPVFVPGFSPLTTALLPILGSAVVPARHKVSCMVAHNDEPCFLLHYLTPLIPCFHWASPVCSYTFYCVCFSRLILIFLFFFSPSPPSVFLPDPHHFFTHPDLTTFTHQDKGHNHGDQPCHHL